MEIVPVICRLLCCQRIQGGGKVVTGRQKIPFLQGLCKRFLLCFHDLPRLWRRQLPWGGCV